MEGPKGTPYENGVFTLDMKFPDSYPFKAPTVKFKTPVWHPNVKTDTGEICNDVLVSQWSPTLNVRYIFTTLHELLKSPNTDTPLEPEIAQKFMTDKAGYEKDVQEYTKKHAS